MRAPDPQDTMGGGIADTADAAIQSTSPSPASSRPSLWSALWATLAVLYLIVARRSFARLG